jgi:hypothetical protein
VFQVFGLLVASMGLLEAALFQRVHGLFWREGAVEDNHARTAENHR